MRSGECKRWDQFWNNAVIKLLYASRYGSRTPSVPSKWFPNTICDMEQNMPFVHLAENKNLNSKINRTYRLVAIAGVSIQVPWQVVKSLQLICRSGTCRVHLQVPVLQNELQWLASKAGNRTAVPVLSIKVNDMPYCNTAYLHSESYLRPWVTGIIHDNTVSPRMRHLWPPTARREYWQLVNLRELGRRHSRLFRGLNAIYIYLGCETG